MCLSWGGGGVYSALFWGTSEWLKVTPRLWIFLATTTLIVLPFFSVLPSLITDWLVLQWILIYAAEYAVARGAKHYRLGIYGPLWAGKALASPSWVNTQQVAELYGVWMLIKGAVQRELPQVIMLQDNMPAIWATINLKSRA